MTAAPKAVNALVAIFKRHCTGAVLAEVVSPAVDQHSVQLSIYTILQSTLARIRQTHQPTACTEGIYFVVERGWFGLMCSG